MISYKMQAVVTSKFIVERNEPCISACPFAIYSSIRPPLCLDKALSFCYQAKQLPVSTIARSSCHLDHSPGTVIRIYYLRRHWISVRTLGKPIRAGIQDSILVRREPRCPLRSERCCSFTCQRWVYICAKPSEQGVVKNIRE